MWSLKDIPIKQQLIRVIMLTTSVALLLTCASFIAYELFSFRRGVRQDLLTIGQIISDNSTAVLQFEDLETADEILSALQVEPNIVAGALYKNGRLFAYYPRDPKITNALPKAPAVQGVQFSPGHLEVFQTVFLDGRPIGTVFLKSTLKGMYGRFLLYMMIALLVFAGSFLVAFLLSRVLQRRVSQPILELAHVAKRVSELGDYSARATKYGADELGFLTETFNQMMTQIHDRDVALSESGERLRLALQASTTGTWDWNMQNNQFRLDEYAYPLLSVTPEEFEGTYDAFLQRVHPEDRQKVEQATRSAAERRQVLEVEFRVVGADDSTHFLVSRGRAFHDERGEPIRMTGVWMDISARRKAEEALRESRERMSSVVDHVIDGIITIDERGAIQSFNPAAERIFQYSAEEVIGRNVKMLMPEPYHGEHDDYLMRYLRTGEKKIIGIGREVVGQRKDRTTFPMDLAVSEFQFHGRQFFTGIVRDITERKQAEAALRESREQMSSVLNHVIDGIITIDAHGSIQSFNPAAEKIFEYSADEVIGRNVKMLMPEPYHSEHDGYVAHYLHTGEKRIIGIGREVVGRRKDQSTFPMDLAVSEFVLGGRRFFTGIVRDITERKRAEEALRQQANLLEQTFDAILVWELDGAIVFWNHGAEETYGYSSAEALGQNVSALLQARQLSQLPPYQEALKEAGHWFGELEHRTRHGRSIIVSSRQRVVRQAGRAFVLESNRDITERRRAEEEIYRLNLELEERVRLRTAELEVTNQELEAFSYSVSHDLRAPLRHIDGYAKILVEELGTTIDPMAQRYLDRIRKSTQKLGQLVDDLLNFSRVGRLEINRQFVPLNSIVDDVLSSLRPEMGARQIEWKIAELPTLKGDANLIRLVLVNLVSNAIKYTQTRERAVIQIDHMRVDDEPVVFVRDNGVGFSMKYAHKLFGVFQRLHRPEEFEGTGVGLATVQRIIQKHGGRVWAEAEVNKGATFYFTLGKA